MAVRIRLRRVGRKKQPTYRIVVAESTAARDGKFIEIVGQYAPRTSENALNLKESRVHHWLDKGALPTDTVRSLLRRAGILKQRHEVRVGAARASEAIPVSEKATGE
jgi:small subunit ribosomal protein S16